MGEYFKDRVSYIDDDGNEKIIILEKNKIYSSPPLSEKEFNAIEKAVGAGDFLYNFNTGEKSIIPLDEDDFKPTSRMSDEELNELMIAVGVGPPEPSLDEVN